MVLQAMLDLESGYTAAIMEGEKTRIKSRQSSSCSCECTYQIIYLHTVPLVIDKWLLLYYLTQLHSGVFQQLQIMMTEVYRAVYCLISICYSRLNRLGVTRLILDQVIQNTHPSQYFTLLGHPGSFSSAPNGLFVIFSFPYGNEDVPNRLFRSLNYSISSLLYSSKFMTMLQY